MSELRRYRATPWRGEDLVGYAVEALDGGVGSVDESTYDMEGSYVVVTTGPWIFGTKAMFPAGVIDGVDRARRTVFVDRTKEQIKNAPAYHEEGFRSDAYRAEIGRYYGPGGAGYRPAAAERDGHPRR